MPPAVGRRRHPEALAEAAREIGAVVEAELVGDVGYAAVAIGDESLGSEVQPALAIYGPKISWVVLAVRGVDVFSGDELKKYIRRRARRKTVPHLSPDDIRKIYAAAADVLPVEWQKSATPVG